MSLWSTILCRQGLARRNLQSQFRRPIYWLHSTVVPLRERDGKVAQFIAICTDITARKQLEHDFEASPPFCRASPTSMGEGVYTMRRRRSVHLS